MTTFGERLKNLRKTRAMGQMELAEQIGVSVQSVSRWETGSCMPDIFQIVPLAKVLGTTSDFLLGMDSSEEEELSKAYTEISRMTGITSSANTTEGERIIDINKKCYEILAPLASKYPMNYTLLLRCCMFGAYHLLDMVQGHFSNYTEKEIHALYNELKRMLSTVVAYEKNLGLKGEAKERLINLHCIMGYYAQAEMEAEDLNYKDRSKMLYKIAEAQSKHEDLILHSMKEIKNEAFDYYNALGDLAHAYSVQGKSQRNKAIEIWNKILQFAESQKELLDHGFYDDIKVNMYICLAKEYLRDEDFDTVLDYIELLTDNCVDYYNQLKEPDSNGYFNAEVFSREEALQKMKKASKWSIMACWEECGDKENNPIVTSDRFKECIKRLDALK